MRQEELIGRTIVDIVAIGKTQHEDNITLDYFESFLLLDNDLCVSMPWRIEGDADVVSIPEGAMSLVREAEDTYSYDVHIHKNRLMQLIFGKYSTYNKKRVENKMKYISGAKIADLLYFEEEGRVFVELSNGNLIGEVQVAPHGTGHASLHWYGNIDELKRAKGEEYIRLKGEKK